MEHKPKHQLLRLLALMCLLSRAWTISAEISASTSEVQATNVTYTFSMSIQNSFSEVSKLVVRFPPEFETPFGPISCVANLNFATKGNLPCAYNEVVRMLTITAGFPLQARYFEFSVSGVVNPKSAGTSGLFQLGTFIVQNGAWLQVETEDREVTINTLPGVLQNESLSLPNNTMAGQYSELTVRFAVSHKVPKDGSLVVNLPVWNPLVGKKSLYEPYVSASSNPGRVKCTAVSGFALASKNDLFCIFERTSTGDRLTVLLARSNVFAEIQPGAELSFIVDQVRGPPTTTAQSGFSFATLVKSGNVIDQSDPTAEIQLQVSKPLVGSPAQIGISSDEPQINVEASLDFEIRTTNPLPPHSTVRITFPDEFGLEGISSVTGNGPLKRDLSTFQVANRTLTIADVNDFYIQSFVFIFLKVSAVRNPAQTFPTGSFQVSISDGAGGQIETVNQGVFFTALPGKIADVSILMDERIINEQNISYLFSMLPIDSFSHEAILKLTIPDQVKASSLTLDGVKILDRNATVTLEFGKYVYIRNGFPNGYNATSDSNQAIKFFLRGFTNPATVEPTDSFEIAIFYEEGVNEVSRYDGNALSIQASPSPKIQMNVKLSPGKRYGSSTGFLNSMFIVEAETLGERPIQMGSYVEVFIPSEFKIVDADRVASSCTTRSGFSDEIACSFVQADKSGAVIRVTGGFDSKVSETGKFSFYLQDIQNPLTTQETGSFGLSLFDATGGLQYYFEQSFTLTIDASPFSYAFVESQSDVVGASSLYQVSLTLGVDTQAGAKLKVDLPPELLFDEERPFECSALTNISPKALSCERQHQSAVIMLDRDALGNAVARNGTTITADIGYIKNPPSQKPTSSFSFKTFLTDGESEFLLNKVNEGITVKSKQMGEISISEVTQTGSNQLDEPTGVVISFKTQNEILVGSMLQVTLSNNFIFEDDFEVYLNGVQVAVQVNKLAFSLTTHFEARVGRMLETASERQFELRISKGLKNPSTGPYRYNYFDISFSSADGSFGIDSTLSKKVWIYQDCVGNCDVCSRTLDFCTSCGLDRETGTTSYFFIENKCLDTCPPGFFGGPSYLCQPCEFPCTECSMAANLCTRCDQSQAKPLANLQTLQCYEECPDGTFKDDSQQLCLPCQAPCYTCTSATQCLSCDRTDSANRLINYFEAEQSCYETCPAVSVPSPSKKCLACTEHCATCEDLTNKCVTCDQGYLMFKQSCVKTCPFGFAAFNDFECISVGAMQIPIPFTIIAFVISVGLGISSFLKGSDRRGNPQQGTAFFQAALACVDVLLRANWTVLIVYLWRGDHKVQAALYLLIMVASVLINLRLWRKMFYNKYRYEEKDRNFSLYYHNYPGTAKFIMNLSYFVSFQAIRLSYSRILGKKRFMAKFSTRRRFYRLIGRLSLIEILVLYLPSIVINVVNLFKVENGSQLFYFDIDSLILVAYATLLIVVVLSLREKLLDPSKLFDWKDLFTSGDLPEEPEAPSENNSRSNSIRESKGFDITGTAGDEQIDVNSEAGYQDRKKMHLYQLEHCDDTCLDWSPSNPRRPVAVFDQKEYRKLADKNSRLKLKRDLYERKRVGDEARIGFLETEIGSYEGTKRDLASQISGLKTQLMEIQRQIKETDDQRQRELSNAEQRKRQQILKKQGYDVPSLKSATDRSYRSHGGSLPRNDFNDQPPRSPTTLGHPNEHEETLADLQLSDGDTGKPAMSSEEQQFTLNKEQHTNLQQLGANTGLNADYSADYSVDQLATNEEGQIVTHVDAPPVEQQMAEQKAHLDPESDQ